jgi:hypothetical protein
MRVLAFVAGVTVALARNNLSRTPPMGWMSWEIYRCRIDCAAEPDDCVSEKLYRAQADAMVSEGFLAAGSDGIHMDDCWEQKQPARDPSSKRLVGDPDRFPGGMKALGDYYHAKGLKYGLYTAESSITCGGYPASKDNEGLDAQTFADWGVDYMKVDGCGQAEYYEAGYEAMGAALQATGRPIEYSCSWPAYINGGNETKQQETFIKMINFGCNGWRNYVDIQCNWHSLAGIIDHWGQYGQVLQAYAGPGHWHDMDMLLIGAVSGGQDGGVKGQRCVSPVEEQTQMAIWAISASPLIMGNDMRSVSEESKQILMNEHAIAVSQDPLGQMGIRLSENSPTQIWARQLANGDVAVALYHRGDPSASSADPLDITVDLAMPGINLHGDVSVFDIWAKKELGSASGNYTAKQVPFHGTAFLRISPVSAAALLV